MLPLSSQWFYFHDAKCMHPFLWQIAACHEFTCYNGLCVNKSRVCDGAPDCVDGSDETETLCGKYQVTYNKFKLCLTATCNRKEFQCDNHRCIAKEWVCDGQADCRDVSDEIDCGMVLAIIYIISLMCHRQNTM